METLIPLIAALITLLALDAGEAGSRFRRRSASRPNG